MRHKIARAYGYATHIKPQGFTSRPPLLTTNKVLRGVQAGEIETPAVAAETRQGAEGDEEGGGGDGAHDSERV